jgi:hypothetical protein
MQFLAKLNFTRVVIIGSFIGAAVLGYFVWQQQAALSDVERVLGSAPMKVRELQSQAMQIAELERQAQAEGLGRQSDPEYYIRSLARDSNVGVGEVDVSPREKRGAGFRDTIFDITPDKRSGRTYSLGQIANYMYLLESKSRRVRVTSVSISPVSAKSKREHEVLTGEWTFGLSMTTREKLDS